MKRLRFSWLGFVTFLVLFFVVSPFLVVIPSSFTTTQFLAFPPQGFTLDWYAKLFERSVFVNAFFYSLKLAALTAILATVTGTLAALALAKYNFRGKHIVTTFFLMPLSLPSVIIGIAVLIHLNQIGLAGSFWGLLSGHLIITIPYVIRLVLTGLTGFDYNLEKAAAIMGARPIRVFFDITLPLIRPAVFSGMVFAFLLSFDNVTVSLFLTAPQNVTLPLAIFHYITRQLDPLVSAASTLLIVISLIPIFIIEKIYGLDRLFGLDTKSK